MRAWVDDEAENDFQKNPIDKAHRAEFQVSAETWRMPYWDWLLRRPHNDMSLCIPLSTAMPLLSQSGHVYDALEKLATKYTFVADWLKVEENDRNPLYSYQLPKDAKAWGYDQSKYVRKGDPVSDCPEIFS